MPKSAVELRTYEGGLEGLVDKAALGEEVLITRDGEPVAQIVPFQRKKPRQRGTAKGMIIIPPDFDEPLEEFKDYE